MDASWLKRRISIAQAEAEHMVSDPRLGSHPVPFGFVAPKWRALVLGLQPGDELWEYESPPETWEHFRGTKGVAVVRDNQVVAFLATCRS